MAMLDRPSARTTPSLAQHETAAHPQGELFSRLKLQPLPLYKHGPEDDMLIPARATLH